MGDKYINISAIDWYEELFMKGKNDSGVWVRYRDVEKLLREAPAADVRPVVRGRWIFDSDRPDTLVCTVCDHAFDVWKWDHKWMHFCPNCGADMRADGTE